MLQDLKGQNQTISTPPSAIPESRSHAVSPNNQQVGSPEDNISESLPLHDENHENKITDDYNQDTPDFVLDTDISKKTKPRQKKLDINFFKPPFDSEDEGEKDKNKLWDLFLDVAAPFPTLEDLIVTKKQYNKRAAMTTHLDSLLCDLRRWSQIHFPARLSLREFSERVEHSSSSSEFHDYRAELIRRYKTSDWKQEATDRKNAAKIDTISPETDTVASKDPEVWSIPNVTQSSKEQIKKRRQELIAIQKSKRKTDPDDPMIEEKKKALKAKREELLAKQKDILRQRLNPNPSASER